MTSLFSVSEQEIRNYKPLIWRINLILWIFVICRKCKQTSFLTILIGGIHNKMLTSCIICPIRRLIMIIVSIWL